MKHTRKRSNGTKRHMLLLPVFLVAVFVLILGASTPVTWADGWVEEFDEFEVFIEINATDLDAGLQGKLDGEAWNWAVVKGPNRHAIFRLRPTGSLRQQGVTEFAWESAEPPFEPSDEAEYTLDDFLARHPEGRYKAWARKLDRSWLRGVTMLTHDLPAGPVVNLPVEDQVVVSGTDLTIEWHEVTTEFDPDFPQGAGTPALPPDAIVEYIVVVEYSGVLNPGDPDEEEIEGSLTIENISPDDADGAGNFSVLILAEFLPEVAAGDVIDAEFEFKIEVGAKEESGNLTFWEVPLVAAPAP